MQVAGFIQFIKAENMVYPSCPLQYNGKTCAKKLQEDVAGMRCERCQQNTEPSWRYLLNVSIIDHTALKWATAFTVGTSLCPLACTCRIAMYKASCVAP